MININNIRNNEGVTIPKKRIDNIEEEPPEA